MWFTEDFFLAFWVQIFVLWIVLAVEGDLGFSACYFNCSSHLSITLLNITGFLFILLKIFVFNCKPVCVCFCVSVCICLPPTSILVPTRTKRGCLIDWGCSWVTGVGSHLMWVLATELWSSSRAAQSFLLPLTFGR